jgi:alkylation response protein AidB-like acyl-CoA dehydrogenase
MDVRLSDEQRALRDSVARVVSSLAPTTVRALDEPERAAKLDAAVAASGWRELRTSVDGGAALASAVEVALVAEELGAGLADAAFTGPTLAAELRRLAGAEPARSLETVAFVPELTAPALATPEAPRTVAIDARGAASALVLVPVPDGYRLAEIALPPTGTPVDLTRPVAVTATAAAMPLAGHLTEEDLTGWTSLGLALTCADLVGVMRGALGLAREYAKIRHQYGAAIGSFQAVQHRLADAYVALEGSRSVALHAAWAVDATPPGEALAAAATAKAYCSRAARAVCETAIQVHGGIGNTWEHPAHLYLRRAIVSTDLLGGLGVSLARVLDRHGIGPVHGLR